ncbi:CDC45 family [Dunaliella salina]|uniref:CDC45 family n=1 Tax=Dunaliella salina TaxID=3046 RepID=A0ABQ7GTH1_DUNSA|nr:CDC45 family [Dunaliella salina]|eukprot:KAF5837908.1 CDC45 family [Dunaliella salina]
MLLPASRLLQVYNAVKTDKHSSEDRAVLIFVANGDVDSLCSMVQLESILAKDDFTTSVIPVENYEDVQEYCKKENLGETEDLKSVFMINCGATDDVRQHCDLSDNVRLVIIDSHRPIWHGYNVEEDQNTLVVLDDDDPVPRHEMPEYTRQDAELHLGGSLRHRDNLEASNSEGEEEEEDEDEEMTEQGVTDQFILQRVDPAQYTQWRQELEDHVAQHNMEEEQEEDIEQYGNNRAKHRPTVVRIEGLRLAFLKRWTLCSSMLYNHHVATRFQTWREAGKKQVDFLLSKLNIRMEQHQASFTSMHPAVEPHLREKLPQTVATFGLNWELLKYDGFELHYKNDFKLPAMDHVMAITAMLGRPRTPERTPQDIFQEALDCLYPQTKEGMALLTKGIERAKDVAVQIVEQGGLALTRKQVQGQRGFWYLDLANISFTGHHEFHHPSTLLKLAIFLRDANAQRMKSTAGLLVSNPFAMPLLEALKDCGATGGYMQATFDSSIFVIKKHLVTAFCEEMRAVVSAYQTCGAPVMD